MKIQNSQNGQTMLLTVMLISSVIISTTAVVGLLMRYEIRSTTDAVNSAKAIFAADSGAECALMKHKEEVGIGGSVLDCGETAPLDFRCIAGNGSIILSNGACYSVRYILDGGGAKVGAISVGKALTIARSFEVEF